jgi:hypothetical protein
LYKLTNSYRWHGTLTNQSPEIYTHDNSQHKQSHHTTVFWTEKQDVNDIIITAMNRYMYLNPLSINKKLHILECNLKNHGHALTLYQYYDRAKFLWVKKPWQVQHGHSMALRKSSQQIIHVRASIFHPSRKLCYGHGRALFQS